MNTAVNVGKCEREQVIKKRNMKLSKRVRISKSVWNLKENMYCIRIIQIVVVYQTYWQSPLPPLYLLHKSHCPYY